MNERTKSKLKLHRLWTDTTPSNFMGMSADDGSDPNAGGGGAGGEEAASKAAAEAAAAEAAAKAGGSNKPSDNEAKLLKEVMQKKEKLEAASAELTALKAQMAKLEELGGLDSLAALALEKKTAEEKQLEAKGEWERLKARMAEENAKILKEKDAKLTETEKTMAALVQQINELTIGSSFSSSKFISEDLILTPAKARVVYGDHFDLVDGKIVGYDKPRGAASRTPLVDGSGAEVSFEEALRKIVEADPDKDSMLRSKMKPGAGSDTRRAEPRRESAPMTGLERISAGLSKLGK